ncbi:hypothetical protein V7087_00095 [Neobacillus niacini]|uniref:hypothetical protein n=1 Tax=Neobacillus niacini TaxID=86668 RepID=UPI002FFFA178
MLNEYIINGEVARDKIAMDIKYRKLQNSDIKQLVKDSNIKAAFIGTNYNEKKPKHEWNKEYLDMLSYAVVAESFNPDYLLYLDEVANHVEKRIKQNKLIIGGFAFFLIAFIIVGVVYLFTMK